MGRRSFGKIVYSFYESILCGIGILVLSFLTFLCLYTSVYRLYNFEFPYFVRDAFLPHALVLAGAVFLTVICQIYARKMEKINTRWIESIMLLLVLAEGIVWVLSTRLKPIGDPLYLLECIQQIHQGDLSCFQTGGYLSIFPNQLGILLAEYPIGAWMGENAFLCFEILNAFLVSFIYGLLVLIAREMGFSKLTQLAVLASGAAFIPMIFLTSFVYGTIPGMFFALCAVWCQLKGRKTRHPGWYAGMGICIGISILLKQNMLIVWIAMLLLQIGDLLRFQRLFFASGCAILILALSCSMTLPNMLTRQLWGTVPEGAGASSWSWIAMGLQEGDRGPGWYNGFNNLTYAEVDFDSHEHCRISQEAIQTSVDSFLQEPQNAASFFLRKEASMWSDPLFETVVNLRERDSTVSLPAWVDAMLSFQGSNRIRFLMDAFQLLIYAGALLYMLKRDSRGNGGDTVLLSAMIGTFVFHTFWEAKALYSITAYLLLFPYAWEGWFCWLPRLEAGNSSVSRQRIRLFLLGGIVFLLLWMKSKGLFVSLGMDTDFIRGLM